MVRDLYRCLVRLHPAAFRVRFKDEMLWVFDEAEATFGAASLIADACTSLVRQWLKNPDVWRWVAASFGGILLLVIAFGSFLPWDRPVHP
jgi:hypothetical protein